MNTPRIQSILLALSVAVVLASCASKAIDRSAWVYVSRDIFDPGYSYNACHSGTGPHFGVRAPRVSDPAKLWIRVPPTSEAKEAVAQCASKLTLGLQTPAGQSAMGTCLKNMGFAVEEQQMYVEPSRFSC